MNTRLQNTLTANSEIKSAAQASCKSMVVKAKKPLPEKTLQGIAELRALSEEANRIRAEYALAGGVMPSVNTVLLCMYEDQTGCKDFRTFLAWKEAGYAVKKGEKAFRIWGQPIKAGRKEELPEDAPEGAMSDDAINAKKLWPTCCVFNESQVELIGSPTNQDDAQEEQSSGTGESLPSGWTESSAGSLATNSDPIEGGIIDKEIVSGKWFVIFNREDLETQTGFESREEAFSAFSAAIAAPTKKEQSATGDNLSPVENASFFVRADYSEHQENRRERYEERAIKAAKESTAQYEKSRNLVDCIPLGQPILVDHYSARDHRRRLDKSWSAMGKSVELSKKAERLESRAESVGTAGIASDDPEAIKKLKEKLSNLEAAQEKMKAANKLVKKNDLQGLIKLGFSEKDAADLLKPNCMNHVGFASYSLQNNNAEIRRTKKRIEDLQKLHNSKAYEYECENFKVYIGDGRVRVAFHFGKPTEEVCKIMSKEYSFNWSRNAVEWLRKCTPNALALAPRLVARLNALDTIY